MRARSFDTCWGGEELSSRLTGTLGVVADEKLVGIAKEVDLAVGKIREIETCHASEHGCQATIFLLDGGAEAGAGGVEVGK